MSDALPARVETVLLDAGGVLLDLEYPYLRRLVQARGVEVSLEALAEAEARARNEINRQIQVTGEKASEFWRDYFQLILGRVGVPVEQRERMIDSLWEAHQRFGLWTAATEHGPSTVAELKRRGFRLGVVSNAEGRVAVDLDGAGYEGMFETVVDSHVVGVEKPDPGIFDIALKRMEAVPETTVFLGDVPSVDVIGARAAGVTPILLDPHDLYGDEEVTRLRCIRELPDCLPS